MAGGTYSLLGDIVGLEGPTPFSGTLMAGGTYSLFRDIDGLEGPTPFSGTLLGWRDLFSSQGH